MAGDGEDHPHRTVSHPIREGKYIDQSYSIFILRVSFFSGRSGTWSRNGRGER